MSTYRITLADGTTIETENLEMIKALAGCKSHQPQRANTIRNAYHEIQADRMQRKVDFWDKVSVASPFGGGFARMMSRFQQARKDFHDDGGFLGVDYE